MLKKKWSKEMVTIPVMVIFLGASGFGVSEETEQPEPEYVAIGDVKTHLDCDNDLDNDEKAKLFNTKYKGKRVVFSEVVLTYLKNSDTVLYLSSGAPSISGFNCIPKVILSDANAIKVEKHKAYEFDCRIENFCEDRTFSFDGEVGFDDCKVLKAIK